MKLVTAAIAATLFLSTNALADAEGLQQLTPQQIQALTSLGLPPTGGDVTLENRLEIQDAMAPHGMLVDRDLTFVLEFRGSDPNTIHVYDDGDLIESIPCPDFCLNMRMEEKGRIMVQGSPQPFLASPTIWHLEYSNDCHDFEWQWELVVDMNEIIPVGNVVFASNTAEFTWKHKRYLAFSDAFTGFIWVYDYAENTAEPKLMRPDLAAGPYPLPSITTVDPITIPTPSGPVVIPPGSAFHGLFMLELSDDRQSSQVQQFTYGLQQLPDGSWITVQPSVHGIANVKDKYLAMAIDNRLGSAGIKFSELMGNDPPDQKDIFQILPAIPGVTDWIGEVLYADGKLFWTRGMSSTNIPGDLGLNFPLFMTNAPANPDAGFQARFVGASLSFDFPSALTRIKMPGVPNDCVSMYVNPTAGNRLAEINYSLPLGQNSLLADTHLPVITWCDD